MSLFVSVSDLPPRPPPGPAVRLSNGRAGSELLKYKNSAPAPSTCQTDRDPWREILRVLQRMCKNRKCKR